MAGAVKNNKIRKTATSDWMDIEKQRGISVSTSVMEFDYEGYKVNILDTPGHQDFCEDTYRTLTAVDSAIIVVDGAKGVETQTRKLMEVCRMRNTPVIIFINKMDREGRDPFDLLDELEEELNIKVRPLSWPINIGAKFKGVYNIYENKLDLFKPDKQRVTEKVEVDINSDELSQHIGEQDAQQLRDDIELIEQNLINVDYVHSIAQGPGRDFIVNLKEPYSSIEFILTPEKKKELIEMLMYGSSSYQPE